MGLQRKFRDFSKESLILEMLRITKIFFLQIAGRVVRLNGLFEEVQIIKV